ncbi:uncharacterized protein SETTUDRAFT_102233 [Exserohilum turcica Et28A]|uniref:Uncharacterized protein n=1 Tax=Exserohilum turcicum (strain 28A) TaxID=671987 RepID=R0J2G0_EXST2|nr:uncharacterized protein SETTUDRAFT_102233 [Exserohilum turcica Et28A]EOA90951.1 hypothetical protein SETTUDRAFT_102233 [Exserohilum turcica Et28A]
MDDQVRISEEQFRRIYAAGFESWAQLHSLVIQNTKLPPQCFFTTDTFPLLPAFPQNLELEQFSDRLTASGSSVWASSAAKCARGIPSFRRRVQLEVARKDPILLSISDLAHTDFYSTSWFVSQNDYLVILVLAWAYILSARWAEIMPPPCSLTYTDSLAKHYDTTIKSDKLTVSLCQGPASTFSEALGFLNTFCKRHNIIDQSHAALAAVLLLPCKINGIRPLLLSVFYEHSIECNAITPWFQGTLAAIKSLAGENPSILGRMCMERRPEVACMWLGSTILGLQQELLQHIKYGQIPIDLECAAWTKTIQSFIQQPVSRPFVVDGYIQRADECRLLFLYQSRNHTRVPICQWKPFGTTPKNDVDLEVQVHQDCEGHELQHQAFVWNCAKGESESPSLLQCSRQTYDHSSKPQVQCTVPIVWEGLNREKEGVSENATRTIFSWLRPDGCAPQEKAIFKHEWFMMDDSDEEEEITKEVNSLNGFKDVTKIEEWLAGTNEYFS